MAILTSKDYEGKKEPVETPPASPVVQTVVEIVEPAMERAPVKVERNFEVYIRLQHPDYTPSNAVTVKFMAGPLEVEIENGFVETLNPLLVETLVGMGYIVMNPHDLEKEKAK